MNAKRNSKHNQYLINSLSQSHKSNCSKKRLSSTKLLVVARDAPVIHFEEGEAILGRLDGRVVSAHYARFWVGFIKD
jgi:hypothetical protein